MAGTGADAGAGTAGAWGGGRVSTKIGVPAASWCRGRTRTGRAGPGRTGARDVGGRGIVTSGTLRRGGSSATGADVAPESTLSRKNNGGTPGCGGVRRISVRPPTP